MSKSNAQNYCKDRARKREDEGITKYTVKSSIGEKNHKKPKSNAQKCREYRERKKEGETKKPAKTSTERTREFRKRRKMLKTRSVHCEYKIREGEMKKTTIIRDKGGKFTTKRKLETRLKKLENLKRRKIDENLLEFLKLDAFHNTSDNQHESNLPASHGQQNESEVQMVPLNKTSVSHHKKPICESQHNATSNFNATYDPSETLQVKEENQNIEKILENSDECDSQFTDLQVRNKFNCYICKKEFDNVEAASVHILFHARQALSFCGFCGVLFLLNSDIVEHYNEHKQTVDGTPCQMCGIILNGESSLEGHDCQIETKYSDICKDVTFNNKSIAQTVFDGDLMPNDKSDCFFACKDEYDGIKIENMDPLEYKPDPAVLDFMMTQSNQICNSKNLTNNHDTTHSNNLISSASYIEQGALEFNTQENQTVENTSAEYHETYNCVICDMDFIRISSFNSHLKLHFQVLKLYSQCKNCSKYFVNELHLSNHIKTCAKV